jgi:hypothetical protein
MRLFVAFCLAWFATITSGAPVRPVEAPARLSAIASREASPLLHAHGPQVVTTVAVRTNAPQHAPAPQGTPWSPVVPAALRALHDARVDGPSYRVAAQGDVAPHFATAPPAQS